MALNAAALVVEANAFVAAYPYLSVHVAGAVGSSASESTAARQQANWSVNASTGAKSASNVAFTGGAASGPATRIGYWSAATGGNFGGSSLVGSGDTTFNAAGQYTANVTESDTAS